MQVYLKAIDVIGRRLYSGKITWLREYIQNAIDSGAKRINLSLKGRDLEILDDGAGINENSLKEDIFSIGYSEKRNDQIGELGIGIYAGLWICDKVVIYSKQNNTDCYKAEFDSKRYNEILKEKPDILFEEGIPEIYSFQAKAEYSPAHDFNNFTSISFIPESRFRNLFSG